MIYQVLLRNEALYHKSAQLNLPKYLYFYLVLREYPKGKAKELGPTPDDKSFPEDIDEITFKSILIT